MAKEERSAVKAGVGYTISNYMLKGLSFFTIPIFARLMSASEYGLFHTYAAYDGVLCMLVGMTLHSCFKSARYKYQGQFEAFVSSCVLLVLVNLAVWVVGVNAVYPFIAARVKMSRIIVNLLLLDCVGNALIHDYNAYLELKYGYKAYFRLAAVNAVSSVALSVLLILTVCRGHAASGRILGTAIPAIAIGIYIVSFFWRKSAPKGNLSYWRFALQFSGPTIPHGLSQVVLSQFDRMMIAGMCGAAQAGVYSFGYNLYTLMLVTANSLESVWGPWLFERLHQGNVERIRKVASRAAFGILVFAAIVMLAAPEIIGLLGTAEYRDAVDVAIPIVLGGFFSFLSMLPVQVEYYFSKTKHIALCSCGAAGLNILLNWIFIPRLGFAAAAYTTMATYLVYFALHYGIAKKSANAALFRNRDFLLVVLLSLMMGGFATGLLHRAGIRWAMIAVIAIAYAAWLQKNFHVAENAVRRMKKGIK